MNSTFNELKDHYAFSLREYLAGGGETALLLAHNIGRTAVLKGLGVLEIAEIYHQTLMATLRQIPVSPNIIQIIERITEFFMENLSTFDMLERGYLEASITLHNLNEALDKNKNFLKNIVASVPSGLLVFDKSTEIITSANKSFCEKFLVSPEEITGKPLIEVLNLIGLSAGAKNTIQSYSTFTGFECQCDSPRAGKLILSISLTGGRLEKEEEFILMVEDITEKKQLEKEMARLERLNLVGEMAAGIGHEIRNPMTAVRGFLQLLADKNEYQKDNEYFTLMIDELDRANSIITEFLSLAKNKPVDLKIQNLNNIIEALYPLIQASGMQSDNDINVELGHIPDLLLNEKEICQLVLNLVRNGLDAMVAGGTLTIKTSAEGDQVVLMVEDEGTGIEANVLEKIGTPFFTTKESGTGLGLAVCYSIATRHNAVIKIKTAPGGTTFFVRFNLKKEIS
jgi:two-component system, sporulation sensor kinase E